MVKKPNEVCQAAQPGMGMTLLYNQSLTLPFIPSPLLFVPPLFLDIFLLKNPMNLTDEQWRLIEPILANRKKR